MDDGTSDGRAGSDRWTWRSGTPFARLTGGTVIHEALARIARKVLRLVEHGWSRHAHRTRLAVHGCSHEAAYAEAFLAKHGDTPIAPWLWLFAGHRRVCALSGFEGLDPTSAAGRRGADEARDRLQRARQAGHPLVRLAADRLLDRPSCYGDRETPW